MLKLAHMRNFWRRTENTLPCGTQSSNFPPKGEKVLIHASGEDYLEAVLMLQKKNGIRSVDLARHME